MKAIVPLVVLALSTPVPLTASALTVLCRGVTAAELPRQVRDRYERSDVVALLGSDPMLVTWAEGRAEPLVEYSVQTVWKGEVGQSIYVNGHVGYVLFGTRDGDSGPFDSIGDCLDLHDSVRRTLGEIYGAGYPASKEIVESPLTRYEKIVLIAAISGGFACLAGSFWLVSFLAS